MAAVDEGLKEFKKREASGTITGKDAFDLYQSYGFPWELTQEMAMEKGIKVDKEEFEGEFTKASRSFAHRGSRHVQRRPRRHVGKNGAICTRRTIYYCARCRPCSGRR